VIHLSLRQIEYFAAAARHGGAARAAQALGVSQPSISKGIAELESLWGEQLFVRIHAKGLELTADGAMRFKQARTLLR
jgi:DNA-binding transcriptional LysR family regulator